MHKQKIFIYQKQKGNEKTLCMGFNQNNPEFRINIWQDTTLGINLQKLIQLIKV